MTEHFRKLKYKSLGVLFGNFVTQFAQFSLFSALQNSVVYSTAAFTTIITSNRRL